MLSPADKVSVVTDVDAVDPAKVAHQILEVGHRHERRLGVSAVAAVTVDAFDLQSGGGPAKEEIDHHARRHVHALSGRVTQIQPVSAQSRDVQHLP